MNINRKMNIGSITGTPKRFRWLYRRHKASLFEIILDKDRSIYWRNIIHKHIVGNPDGASLVLGNPKKKEKK